MNITSLSEIIGYISNLNLRISLLFYFLIPIENTSQLTRHLPSSVLFVKRSVLILNLMQRSISLSLTWPTYRVSLEWTRILIRFLYLHSLWTRSSRGILLSCKWILLSRILSLFLSIAVTLIEWDIALKFILLFLVSYALHAVRNISELSMRILIYLMLSELLVINEIILFGHLRTFFEWNMVDWPSWSIVIRNHLVSVYFIFFISQFHHSNILFTQPEFKVIYLFLDINPRICKHINFFSQGLLNRACNFVVIIKLLFFFAH